MANNLKVFDTIQEYERATIPSNAVSYIKEDNSIRYSGGIETSMQAPITGIKVNGDVVNIDSDGKIDIGSVQETLVSGSNIKTINGFSVLGYGNIDISTNGTIDLSGYVTKEELSSVATSGDYNDLSNKPDNVVESTVSGWGFTKNPGTITSVSANGTTIASNGAANIPAATTSKYGVTKLSSATNSSSTSLAATASAVKAAYDLANSKVSWLADDTIYSNGLEDENGYTYITPGVKGMYQGTVLATEDYVDNAVANAGGGGGSSSGSGAYSEVNHGTSDTTFTLTPNTFHIWDEVSSLTLTLGDETAGVANEFLFQFNSGSTATTLSLPDTLKWANDSTPTIEANKIYQISILKGLGSVLVWDKVVSIFPVTLSYTENNSELGTKVHNELFSIVGSGSGVLNDGDLTFIINNQSVVVTNVFYVSRPYEGYVLYDTGMEYYVLRANGQITYYFYD